MKQLARSFPVFVLFLALLVPTAANGQNKIKVSKTTIAYGSRVAGTAKVDSFYVKNDSSDVISLTSVTTNTAAYVIGGNTTASINPNDSAWFTVTFTPSAVLSYPDTVKVSHNDPASANPLKIVLSGSGTTQLTTSKTSLVFGSVLILTSKNDSLYLKNVFNSPIDISNLTTNFAAFIPNSSPILPYSLNAGDSLLVRVTFNSDTLRSYTDTLKITHAGVAASNPILIPMTGTATSNMQFVSAVSGSTITSLTMANGLVSVQKKDSLQIKNTGAATATVTAITFANPEFTNLTPLPFALTSGDSQKIFIGYTGSSVGRDSTTMSVIHDSPGKGTSPAKLPVIARALANLNFSLGGVTLDTNVVRIHAANTGATPGTVFPSVAVDSPRVGLVSILNRGISTIRVDSIRFAGGINFRSITPTPYDHRVGDAYDRIIQWIYQPLDVSAPTHKDTIVVFTNDTIPGGNMLRLAVEGSSRNAVYVRSQINRTDIRFGDLAVGTVRDSLVRVYNYSTIGLTIDSVKLAVGNPKFVLGAPSRTTLGKGDTSLISVRFAPNDTLPNSVTQNDTVLVYSAGSGTAARIPISGRPVITIAFNPSGTLVVFGDVSVSAFKDSVIKVFNRTSTQYRIDSLVVYSGEAFNVESNSLETILAPGDSTSIQVRFTPLAGITYNDTLYIWHNFPTAIVANPRKVTLRGIGTTQQIFDPGNFITVDNATGIDGFPISSPDSSYMETGSFWQNTTGFNGTHRRAPNLAGTVAGVSAKYTFRIDSADVYLAYHFCVISPNVGAGYYVQFRKFGIGGVYDSLRYSLVDNQTLDPAASTGTWLPLAIHHYEAFGPGSASITIGADNLSNPFLRIDAMRLVRSRQVRDLEFGRRTSAFAATRVQEQFPQITLGEEFTKPYRLYNLGTDTLTISNIILTATRTPVPWFFIKDYTPGTPIKIPPLSVNGVAESGGYVDIQLSFAPFQEGTARDSIVFVCDDEAEPNAYTILNGEGLNYNFIMNASSGNAEPHFRAPGPPAVPTIPRYYEGPVTGWANSATSNYPYPISGGNSSSRVNVGALNPGAPHQAFYNFELPDIAANGITPTDGQYFLEFSGPITANGATAAKIYVTHEIGIPPDSVIGFNQNKTGADPVFGLVGGTGKTFTMIPGGQITVEFRREAGVGAGFLRVDLLRVRKVPTGSLVGTSLPVFNLGVSFGQVSYRDPGGPTGNENKQELAVKSVGESQLLIKSVTLASGLHFSILNPPITPLYLRAITGELKLNMAFTPDKIDTAFADTLIVESNSIQDSVLRVPLAGNGIGAHWEFDDDATLDAFSSVPSISGIYSGTWNTNRMNNWQTEAWVTSNTTGYRNTRQQLPIYFNGNGLFEWYPLIPEGSIDSMYVQVVALIRPGETKGSPAARYKVWSRGGVLAKDTLVNQNGLVTIGAFGQSEINLGSYWFERGGRDLPNSKVFGSVRVENDTSAVSAYYTGLGQTNVARRDTLGLIADAIIVRELAPPAGSLVGVAKEEKLPTSFQLSQNYPNPFNPTTTINFDLPERVPVDLRIYDLLGREVRVLVSSEMNPGFHHILWDGRNSGGQSVSTGVYFYRIVAGAFVQSKKMLLLK